jgi:hypothetical protein
MRPERTLGQTGGVPCTPTAIACVPTSCPCQGHRGTETLCQVCELCASVKIQEITVGMGALAEHGIVVTIYLHLERHPEDLRDREIPGHCQTSLPTWP